MELYDWAWPRQVCYGKINIMEGLTLLSLSRGDRCVYYWTGYITQTRRHALQCARTFRATLYVYGMQTCTHTHTHTQGTHKEGNTQYTCSGSRDIHTCTQAIHIFCTAHHPPTHSLFLSLSALVMPVCMCECACQRVTECSNDHNPDTGILTAASFHRHID